MLFGWNRPKICVEPRLKRWIEIRMSWLIGEFGWDRLLKKPDILPTAAFFPDPFDGSQSSVRALFERTCGYMELDASRIDLRFHHPNADSRLNPRLAVPQPDWVGLYDSDHEKTVIWIEASRRDDPESLVATFAHELAHARLLGEQRISVEEGDMEQLTDLATVYFGLGVFPANCSFRETNYSSGMMHYHSTSTQGYLSREAWSYALALREWLRKERKPECSPFLQRSVRLPYRQALAYLWSTEDAEVAPGECGEETHPCELLVNRPSSTLTDTDDAAESPSEADSEPQDDPGTHGMFLMDAGEWEAAVRAFSQVIVDDAEDHEAYQHRALAYLELGQPERALADAETAVRLDPDESENYFARGLAKASSGN